MTTPEPVQVKRDPTQVKWLCGCQFGVTNCDSCVGPQFDHAMAILNVTRQELAETRRENEELKRDRERLNWIEEHSICMAGGSGGTYSWFSPLDTECFRQAIDAAMAQEKGKE